jgi:hypothetical protein
MNVWFFKRFFPLILSFFPFLSFPFFPFQDVRPAKECFKADHRGFP